MNNLIMIKKRYLGIPLMVYLFINHKKYLHKLILCFYHEKIKKEKQKMILGFKEENNKFIISKNFPVHRELTNQSMTKYDIVEYFKTLSSVDVDKNKISGCLYSDESSLNDLLEVCFKYFNRSNPLHPDVYPGVRKMEAEIIHMCGTLMNSPNPDAGSFTSGGTESILLACRCYRDKYKKLFPEIIVHKSAHAAYWKAGQYFNIKIVEVDNLLNIRPTWNTIAVVCSAPSFNYGLVDPIEKISKICKKHSIGLHVDACLGGFLLPFHEKNSGSPLFDFKLPGVTSISLDTHKYGYGPKGGSVILYRDAELFKHQMFVKENWSGGIYATTNLTGSRDGNVVALTWATMMNLGKDKYTFYANQIKYLTTHLANEISKIDGLFIYGKPNVCIVAIGCETYDVLFLADALKEKKWTLNILQDPNSFHFCVTQCHTKEIIDEFIKHANECHNELKKKDLSEQVSQSIYGTTQKIDIPEIIDDLARDYLYCLNGLPCF